MHTDYFSPSKPRIRIFTDTIEFYNPGGLPKDIEILRNKDISLPRNPIITKLFRMVKLAENAGFGIDKIEHNWLKYNNTKPIYDLDFDSTILKFKINNNVPDNRLDIIVQMIKENNTILLQEIADKLKVSKRTIRRDIEKLKAKKNLQREGGERSGYWKIINQ